VEFFTLADYWSFYLAFTAFVLLLLAVDLGVFHREAHVVSVKEAAAWSVIWVCLSLAFNYGFYQYCLHKFTTDPTFANALGKTPELLAQQFGLEFLTGYVIEKALSVDNIFVFVVIFTYFGIPPKYQHRILFYGILGALIFRSIFIAIGSVLMQYSWVPLIFGVFLIATGIKIFFTGDKKIEPEKNPVLKMLRKIMPLTTELHDQRFFVRKEKVLYATPLFAALLVVEFTDIIFAIDSVPAIFAITREPFIVFTSNVFAILGLRAMYFLLAGVMDKFHLLKYGLGLVLVFVGAKMTFLNELYGGKFPVGLSLAIIGTILGVSVVLSFIIPAKTHDKGVK